MKRSIYLGLVLGCLIVLAGSSVAWAADVHVGAMIHPWFGYPSQALDLGIGPAYTVGPSLSFTSGLLSSTLWYAVDPNRTGYMCVQDSFGVPEGQIFSLGAILHEVGWRISSTGPAFVSASVSRLQWAAAALCNEEVGAMLVSTQIAAGGGIRIGPAWAALEYGILWTEATPGFTDVSTSPVGNVLVSFGVQARVNPIPAGALRHPVTSFPVEFEESFPVGCIHWDWEGQAGYARAIDEQLGIVVEHAGQTIVQAFDSEFPRCAVDLDLIPRSSANPNHSCGVVVRYHDPMNYEYVEIRTDGYVRLTRMVDGAFEAMSSWERAGSLRVGEHNALRVVLLGNRVIAYLNGRKILDEEEISFVSGQIGVLVKTYGEPGAWAAFDDVVIRSIGRNIVLDPRTDRAREIERFERAGLTLLAGVAAYVTNREGLIPLSYGFVALSLYEIFAPSTHLVEVR